MEIIVNSDQLIVTKTDVKGIITYANPYFLELVGYSENELLNKPHNVIRHEDMPKVIFKYLWDNIKNGKEVNAFVKNKTKNGDYYWVKGNITPSFQNGQIIGYFSVRRSAAPESIKTIDTLYRELKRLENAFGVEKSFSYLIEQLQKMGVSYEEFISKL